MISVAEVEIYKLFPRRTPVELENLPCTLMNSKAQTQMLLVRKLELS